MSEESAPSAAPKGNGRKWAFGCLGAVALFIGLTAACGALLSAGGSSDDWEPTTVEARAICEDWVREQLKAPATARFSDGTESGGVGSYVITGSVDAENSFGAMLRTEWTCTITYVESDEKWHGQATLDE